jgi:hypothetical protein
LVTGQSTAALPPRVERSQDGVVIEVKYDDFPAETGWTRALQEGAGTLIAEQFTGSYITKVCAVFKTAYFPEGAYTYAMNDK